MLSIIIPTLNAARALPDCLTALMPGVTSGLIREVIISDGGSTDPVAEIANACGAVFLSQAKGRGPQLAAGAQHAKGEWLLFLHADTALSQGWQDDVATFIATTGQENRAAYFPLAFNSTKEAAKLVAKTANVRAMLFGLPYGDQGLLIRKHHYKAIGGYGEMILFEDVDLIRKIIKADGRKALSALSTKAVTDPARYEKDGYAKRVVKNTTCIIRYFLGHSPDQIAAKYK